MYAIRITKSAQKQMDKMPDNLFTSIRDAIFLLAETPRPFGYKKLKGYNAYRIRKGDYRIIYEIQDEIITIIITAIGHRRDVYK